MKPMVDSASLDADLMAPRMPLLGERRFGSSSSIRSRRSGLSRRRLHRLRGLQRWRHTAPPFRYAAEALSATCLVNPHGDERDVVAVGTLEAGGLAVLENGSVLWRRSNEDGHSGLEGLALLQSVKKVAATTTMALGVEVPPPTPPTPPTTTTTTTPRGGMWGSSYCSAPGATATCVHGMRLTAALEVLAACWVPSGEPRTARPSSGVVRRCRPIGWHRCGGGGAVVVSLSFQEDSSSSNGPETTIAPESEALSSTLPSVITALAFSGSKWTHLCVSTTAAGVFVWDNTESFRARGPEPSLGVQRFVPVGHRKKPSRGV